jgi:hypothetical protein
MLEKDADVGVISVVRPFFYRRVRRERRVREFMDYALHAILKQAHVKID